MAAAVSFRVGGAAYWLEAGAVARVLPDVPEGEVAAGGLRVVDLEEALTGRAAPRRMDTRLLVVGDGLALRVTGVGGREEPGGARLPVEEICQCLAKNADFCQALAKTENGICQGSAKTGGICQTLANPPAEPAEGCIGSVGVEGDMSCGELEKAGHCRNCPKYAEAARRLMAREPARIPGEEAVRPVAAEEGAGEEMVAWVPFRSGGEWYAVEAGSVGFAAAGGVAARGLPGHDARFVPGLVNLDGELVLCVNPSGRGLAAKPAEGDEAGRLLVVGEAGARYAVVVEEIGNPVRVAKGAAGGAAGAAGLAGCVRGTVPGSDPPVRLLDAGSFSGFLARLAAG